jgi:hypothetical protein
MSATKRVFSERLIPSVNIDGKTEWYCLAREGMLGPYPSEDAAYKALCEFVQWCQQVGATGGRDQQTAPGQQLTHPEVVRWMSDRSGSK